jgi:hypothetical protein
MSMSSYLFTGPVVRNITANSLKRAIKQYYLDTGAAQARVGGKSYNLSRHDNRLHISPVREQHGGAVNGLDKEKAMFQYQSSERQPTFDSRILQPMIRLFFDITYLHLKTLVPLIRQAITAKFEVEPYDVLILDVNPIDVAGPADYRSTLDFTVFGVNQEALTDDFGSDVLIREIREKIPEAKLIALESQRDGRVISYSNVIKKLRSINNSKVAGRIAYYSKMMYNISLQKNPFADLRDSRNVAQQ